MQCGKLYDMHYRRGIRKRVSDKRLDLGSAVHAGMEEYIRTKAVLPKRAKSKKASIADPVKNAFVAIAAYCAEAFNKLPKQLQKDIEVINNWEEVETRAIDIVKRAGKDFTDQFDVVLDPNGDPYLERELSTAVIIDEDDNSEAELHGIVDCIAKRKSDGRVYLVDFKVVKNFKTPDDLEMDLQGLIYTLLARANDIEALGFFNYQISSASPAVPEITKKDTVSKAKRITTEKMYLDAIKEVKGKEADYEDALAYVRGIKWFELVGAHYPEAVLHALWENMISPWVDMVAEDTLEPMPARGFACKNCDLKEVCFFELKNYDTSLLLAADGPYFQKGQKPIQQVPGLNIPGV